jgi:hypothetical protein
MVVSSPALAEPESGSRIDRKPMAVTDSANDPVLAKVVNQFARCVANSRPQWSDQILAMDLMSAEQVKAATDGTFGINSCFTTGQYDLALSPLSLIGGLAEQRFVERFATRPVEALAKVSDDQLFASAAAPTNTVEDLAMCLARKDPATVRKLIDAKPTSADESALITRLIPNLGPCVPQGLSIKFNKQTVRAYAAVGLYSLMSNEAALTQAMAPKGKTQ